MPHTDHLDLWTLALLALTAALGGAINAVAGGGSFVTFPTLVWAGLGPIAANATSTVALWPGSLGSAWGYRREIPTLRRHLKPLASVSVLGGALGSWLLLHTRDETFSHIVPWLLGGATALFAFSGWLMPRLRKLAPAKLDHPGWLAAAQFVIAVYGGYFGGGMGILMLAGFALAGVTDIHASNGMKSLLGALINGAAVALFAASAAVHWLPACAMVVGSIGGGYVGARLARRVDAGVVRWLVVAVGTAMTGAFVWRA